MSDIARHAEQLVRHDGRGRVPCPAAGAAGAHQRDDTPCLTTARRATSATVDFRGFVPWSRVGTLASGARSPSPTPRGRRRRDLLPAAGTVRRRGHRPGASARSRPRSASSLPADLVDRQACLARRRRGAARVSAASTSSSTTPATTGTVAPLVWSSLQPEHVERVLRTNLHAVIWLCQAALAHLGPGSSIINTTSIQAVRPVADAARLRRDQGGNQQPHRQSRCGTGP